MPIHPESFVMDIKCACPARHNKGRLNETLNRCMAKLDYLVRSDFEARTENPAEFFAAISIGHNQGPS
jgi:hypothetical protein